MTLRNAQCSDTLDSRPAPAGPPPGGHPAGEDRSQQRHGRQVPVQAARHERADRRDARRRTRRRRRPTTARDGEEDRSGRPHRRPDRSCRSSTTAAPAKRATGPQDRARHGRKTTPARRHLPARPPRGRPPRRPRHARSRDHGGRPPRKTTAPAKKAPARKVAAKRTAPAPGQARRPGPQDDSSQDHRPRRPEGTCPQGRRSQATARRGSPTRPRSHPRSARPRRPDQRCAARRGSPPGTSGRGLAHVPELPAGSTHQVGPT